MEQDPIRQARDNVTQKIIAASEGVDPEFAKPLGTNPVTGEPIWPSGGIVTGRAAVNEAKKRQEGPEE